MLHASQQYNMESVRGDVYEIVQLQSPCAPYAFLTLPFTTTCLIVCRGHFLLVPRDWIKRPTERRTIATPSTICNADQKYASHQALLFLPYTRLSGSNYPRDTGKHRHTQKVACFTAHWLGNKRHRKCRESVLVLQRPRGWPTACSTHLGLVSSEGHGLSYVCWERYLHMGKLVLCML